MPECVVWGSGSHSSVGKDSGFCDVLLRWLVNNSWYFLMCCHVHPLTQHNVPEDLNFHDTILLHLFYLFAFLTGCTHNRQAAFLAVRTGRSFRSDSSVLCTGQSGGHCLWSGEQDRPVDAVYSRATSDNASADMWTTSWCNQWGTAAPAEEGRWCLFFVIVERQSVCRVGNF